jgi:CHASE2 domain-containing sensor protein
MFEAIYLAALAVTVAGFLTFKKIPRPTAVGIWCGTFLIFVVFFFISLQIFDRFANKYEDGFIPYLPPVIPALMFLIWRLRKIRPSR